MPEKILVVGGGITGLVAAARLLDASPGRDLELVEAADVLGGTMGTDIVDGFIFERGPNGFLDNVPHAVDLARWLGIEDRLLPCQNSANKRYLLKDGKLRALPMGAIDFLRSPVLSLRGRIRVLLEPFQPRAPAGTEDSVASFGRRRIGAEATTTLLDPLVTGIYAGDVEKLSLPSAFPRIHALERDHGGLFKGMFLRALEKRRARRKGAVGAEEASRAARKEGSPSGPGGRLHSFSLGLEELIRTLAGRLEGRIRLSSPVQSICRAPAGYRVELVGGRALEARAVLLAVPAHAAARIVGGMSPGLSEVLGEIPCAPVVVLCTGYRRGDVGHDLDGFGFLIPRNQGLRTLGMIWVSSIFPPHAPDGHVSLRVLFGGARDPRVVDLSDDELERLMLDEVGRLLGIRGRPVARRVYRYERGIPQYNVGHGRRLERIEGCVRDLPGLFLAGNSYKGIGINDSVLGGAEAARAALDFLGRSPARP